MRQRIDLTIRLTFVALIALMAGAYFNAETFLNEPCPPGKPDGVIDKTVITWSPAPIDWPICHHHPINIGGQPIESPNGP